jgi:hypothetical protein
LILGYHPEDTAAKFKKFDEPEADVPKIEDLAINASQVSAV